MASVSPSTVQLRDQRNSAWYFQAALASGLGAGTTDPEGCVFNVPQLGSGYVVDFHVSANPSAGEGPALSVRGSFEGPSITASDANWFTIRGDTATGTNVRLIGVSCNQYIHVLNDAERYQIRVSAIAAPAGAVTDPLTFRVRATRPKHTQSAP